MAWSLVRLAYLPNFNFLLVFFWTCTDSAPDGQTTSSGHGDELRAAADDKDEGELWATATTAAGKQAAAVGPGRAAGDVGRR